MSELLALVSRGRYASDLRQIRVSDLLLTDEVTSPIVRITRFGATPEETIRMFYHDNPRQQQPATFFARALEIPRWEAQRLMRTLCDAGFLARDGVTSATRYRLAPQAHQSEAACKECNCS